ncbi:hypothetical protein [Flectobacillus roseus]|uniref:Outer membrane protein beta-barrel domain-containing protein n=1 Tax=Flectobacillus roseus TaxID=502259 RepID=A0ABT6YA54_9BACT|nr:hypothetical protein [Flectobacillus roseus]MDI9860464.1 hypothetical protein [Flectobacillus roseus]
MKKTLLTTILFLCILHFGSLGQIQISSGFSYIGEGGWGNKAQYAGSGIDISAKKYLTENLRIGMNWGVYDMRTNLMVQTQSDALPIMYGRILKRIVPLNVSADYFLWKKHLIKPFVGLSTGTYMSQYDTQIEKDYEYLTPRKTFENSINWGFSPSVGFQLQESADRLGLYLKFSYTGIQYSSSQGGYTSFYGVYAGFSFKFGKKVYWRPPVLTVPKPAPYFESKDQR